MVQRLQQWFWVCYQRGLPRLVFVMVLADRNCLILGWLSTLTTNYRNQTYRGKLVWEMSQTVMALVSSSFSSFVHPIKTLQLF